MGPWKTPGSNLTFVLAHWLRAVYKYAYKVIINFLKYLKYYKSIQFMNFN